MPEIGIEEYDNCGEPVPIILMTWTLHKDSFRYLCPECIGRVGTRAYYEKESPQ